MCAQIGASLERRLRAVLVTGRRGLHDSKIAPRIGDRIGDDRPRRRVGNTLIRQSVIQISGAPDGTQRAVSTPTGACRLCPCRHPAMGFAFAAPLKIAPAPSGSARTIRGRCALPTETHTVRHGRRHPQPWHPGLLRRSKWRYLDWHHQRTEPVRIFRTTIWNNGFRMDGLAPLRKTTTETCWWGRIAA